MTGTREEFLEWDALMEDVGVPKEKYIDWRADRLARLIFNSTPAHLTLNEWCQVVTNALWRFAHKSDPGEPLAGVAIRTDVKTDNT